MGGRRGQLITLVDRQNQIKLIDEAVSSGARQDKACEIIGLSVITLQGWRAEGAITADKRPTAIRPTPINKLTKDEVQAILEICNTGEFAALPPSQIVPVLADRGEFIGSESNFYFCRGLFQNDD